MTATDLSDVIDAIAQLALFADLSRPQLEAAAHIFEEDVFTAGQRVLRKGFSGAGFYLIIEGEADVQLDEQQVARLSRGDFFGEISILLGSSPTADIVARTALRCLVLPASDLQGFLEAHPKVMYRMLQAEASRLHRSLQWRN
ncbi:MAG: cyclic nucleotide-binding domain-containing protein [Actinomycetota bacterium]